MAGFVEDNARYEDWLREQCAVVEDGLSLKQEKMREEEPFVFLRATYFRWARQTNIEFPKLAKAPQTLAIGDAHIENFGTWRDVDGRLVWGVNDFDEGAKMPYPFDLVRLAASALLSEASELSAAGIAVALLRGYEKGLRRPRPLLLDDQRARIREDMVVKKDVDEFWLEIDSCADEQPPPDVVAGFEKSLPRGATVARYASRVAGAGSLGRPRYLAIADFQGGRVLREAKAVVPSAWYWARGAKTTRSDIETLSRGPSRAPDPRLKVLGNHVFRRLAPDSGKIELGGMCREIDERLFRAMGAEIGSIHSSGGGVDQILDDLESRKADWLARASKKAAKLAKDDQKEWKHEGP